MIIKSAAWAFLSVVFVCVSPSWASAATIGLRVNLPPLCEIGGPYQAVVLGVVMFDGSLSSDPDGTIVNTDWKYGDGSPIDFGAGPTPNHSYAAPGFYTVKMRVTDNMGAQTICQTVIKITSQLPVCDAGGPYQDNIFSPVVFDGTASIDPDGTIVQGDWDYGDGTIEVAVGPTPTHHYTSNGNFTATFRVTDDNGDISLCETLVEIVPVSGALVFVGDDADEHCQGTACGAYAPYLLKWTLDNSNNVGTGILAVGLQSDDPPFFTSTAKIALMSWVALLPGPTVSVTTVTTPGALMGVNLDDYQLLYIPSYGGTGNQASNGHVEGGINSEMLAALTARQAEIEDFVLRRGGSLLAFTQAEGDFIPQISDGYGWSPIPFTSEPADYTAVSLTSFAKFGDLLKEISPPLSVPAAADLTHVEFHNVFLPDLDDGFSGLNAIATSEGVPSFGKAAILGGIPARPILGIPLPPLLICDAGGPYFGGPFAPLDLDATGSIDTDGIIVQGDWNYGDGTPLDIGAGATPSHLYSASGLYTVTVTVTDNDGNKASCSSPVLIL